MDVSKREEIREVFARNRGSAAELARDLDVSPVTIHHWLAGRIKSERIAIAAAERAKVLRDEMADVA